MSVPPAITEKAICDTTDGYEGPHGSHGIHYKDLNHREHFLLLAPHITFISHASLKQRAFLGKITHL